MVDFHRPGHIYTKTIFLPIISYIEFKLGKSEYIQELLKQRETTVEICY